ncbi:MAG TPA: spermidine synthase [Bacteroidia bacterium]|nr:spermidine synthase [Bacteroidia bacterium]
MIKKILSYLYPITVAKINSQITPGLEVRIENGKQVLNAKHSNYSFGKLHEVMFEAISSIEISNPANVLLLGLGSGSAVTILHNLNKKISIDAVELDTAVINTAYQFFDIGKYPNLVIIEADAFSFVESCNQSYTLIIIDLFIDDKVPDAVFKHEFLLNCKKVLSTNGTIILNASILDQPFIRSHDELICEVFNNVNSKFIKGNLVHFIRN